MSLTKADIVHSIYIHSGCSKKESIELMESLLNLMKKTLESGEDVLISGFGKFCVKEKSERRGRNPTTGEDLGLGARRVVTFKCSSVLKQKINTRE